MGEKRLVLAMKLATWLKFPMMLLLALIMVRPVQVKEGNSSLIANILGRHDEIVAMATTPREVQRQADVNGADIKALERRLDLIEALHIDASIASMKATIDYDHALLMTIAGALLIMLVGNVLGYFKKKVDP